MAGLMKSWSEFELYASCNMIATKRLLEAARDAKVPQVIHISTSSVYGKEATGPEDSPLTPFSPYGITKVAAENLCRAFEANFGVPVTILRYFSVYGPRQRPDMAYNILIRDLFKGEPFTMYGDGEQTRSNTFVADCVNATILAFEKRDAALGQVFNVGGGEIVSLNQVIRMLEEITGKKAEHRAQAAAARRPETYRGQHRESLPNARLPPRHARRRRPEGPGGVGKEHFVGKTEYPPDV